jgi:rhamnogalacturonan endolyase
MPDGSTCNYTPNDMSVGDLDGDGQLDLVLKWDPSNAQDN